eukprot:gene21323-63900_t
MSQQNAAWLREKNVASLINDALSQLLHDRPDNVHRHLSRWFAEHDPAPPNGASSPALMMGRSIARPPVPAARAPSAHVDVIHFNDVYNVEPQSKEPAGGAARFVAEGKQMVPVLNKADVECALYGNHDFDFGIDTLERLAAQCRFPWLMSNAFYRPTGRPLASGAVTHYSKAASESRAKAIA